MGAMDITRADDRPMGFLGWTLAAAITLGAWIGILVRMALIVAGVLVGLVVLCFLLLVGMSHAGQRVERGTRQ